MDAQSFHLGTSTAALGGTTPGRFRRRSAILTALALVCLGLPFVAIADPALAVVGVPAAPIGVCGNGAVLDGPEAPPAGAVRVDVGQNLHELTQASPAGTTFWLAPGTHTLGQVAFSQVIPKDGNVYLGAPGAVIDGQGLNRAAFTQHARDVRISNLTITGFVAPRNEGVVNHDGGIGWTVEANTIRNNSGAGVLISSDNVVRSNCLADNGQYGYTAFRPGGMTDIVLDGNEVVGNNTDDWNNQVPGCGCGGAGKFWDVTGAVVTDNWVHDNRGPGIWADTNNVGFLIEGNLIEHNDGEGILYETSYNARIVNNTLRRNALVKGQEFAAREAHFPVGAIYISESGGDARVFGGTYATMEIAGNLLEDNWGGVVLWENADRFCGSSANTSTGYCTKGGAGSLATCTEGTISSPPYLDDCRWKTQNVSVHDNEFRFARSAVGCTTVACGQQAVLSNYGTSPSWSPYHGRTVQNAITYSQNNRFFDNTYVGDWKYTPWETKNYKSWDEWRSEPYNQDERSTFSPGPGATTTVPATTTTTIPPAPPNGNILDADTAGLEGSQGLWVRWFSSAISSSSAQARSGTRSLEVDVTAPWGWGVNLRNAPGYAATPGPKTLSFWGMSGSGTGLSATMSVRWRSATGANIRTDVVSLALTPSWAQASAEVVAPSGTSRVMVEFTNSSGTAGNSLYLDDVYVGEPVPAPPNGNILDADTAGLEGSQGLWVRWFSSTISSSSAQARSGTRSLAVDVTAPWGWGVNLRNAPGYAATPGPKTLSFWGMSGSGTGLSATMSVRWRSATGANIRTDVVSLALTPSWAQASAEVVAPSGTSRVMVEFTNSSGTAGNSLYLDDVYVGDLA